MATVYEIFRDCYLRTRNCDSKWFEYLMLAWYFDFDLHFDE